MSNQDNWNYSSSKEQLQAELAQMHKELTDPEEREKAQLRRDRESYAQDAAEDYGLDESDSA
jgi:hypothetical protein